MSLDVEKIVREYINKSLHLSLATVDDNKPWVCEVHFAYDDQLNLYFRSKTSTRHSQEITKNPAVAGNIVRQHDQGEYPHAIYFEGNAELITDGTRYDEIFVFFKNCQNADESIVEDAKLEDGHRFHKITVKNWAAFGKFGEEKGQKYVLAWNGGLK